MSKSIELNLKQFKHVKSDEHSTTLQHKDGHHLTLSHKALSKGARVQLEALAATQPKAEEKASEPRQAYADGGQVAPITIDPKFQAGQAVDPSGIQLSPEMLGQQGLKAAMQNGIQIDSAAVPVQAAPEAMPMAPQPQLDPITGTMRMPYQPDNTPISIQDVAQHGMMGAILGRQNETPKVQDGLQGQPSFAPQAPMAAPQAQGAASPTSMEGMFGAGYNSSLKGLEAEAGAKSALAKDVVAQREQQITAQQAAQDTYQSQYNTLEQERQAHLKDIQDGHIDPEKYWTGDKNGEGGHSKIAAGIGMILAGFNPTNNPNQAIAFLKNQMEMNLQAQSKNLDSKQNLLKANLQQFGNLRDATTMTRIMQHDVMANQLELSAAKAASPMAKAQLLQAAGKLKMEAAPMFQQFAMRQAMMKLTDGTAGDPSNTAPAEHMISMARAMGNTEYAKDLESKLVPGVGLAKIPVPQSDRDEIRGKATFAAQAQHYVDWVKKNAGTMNPAKITQGATMAADLQGVYRQASKGGVYKEGEQEFIERLIPSKPDQFLASLRTLPKVEELVRSNNAALNQLKSSYKLPIQATPTRPQISEGQVVQGKDGRSYKRVGNAMVPIK